MIPYAILALIALALGAYTLIVLPRDGWRRYAAPAMFGAIILALFVLTFSALGNPRPSWLYRSWGPDVQVISVTWEEGEAIWVWVRVPGSPEPVSIVLPWSESEADELNQAVETAAESGGTVELELSGPEGPGAVHPVPPQPMPLKE